MRKKEGSKESWLEKEQKGDRGESNNNEIAKRGGGGGGGGSPARFSSRLNGQSRGREEGGGRCNFSSAEKQRFFSPDCFGES